MKRDEVKTSFEPEPRERKISLHVIVSALIYVLKTGCQWRFLPEQYGKWQLGYYYFRKWMAYGVLEDRLYRLVGQLREEQGRQAEPSAAVVDTQWVKNAAGVREATGYDGVKK